MEYHLTTMREVFTELESIQHNIAWYRVYNTSIKVQLCTKDKKKWYRTGKPREYTFSNLNLLRQFGNMLGNCKLQKI